MRFGLVGVAATAVYAIAAYFLVQAMLTGALWAAVIAQGLSMIVSYLGHQGFTFEGASSHARSIPRFLALVAATFVANLGCTWLLDTVLQCPHWFTVVIVSVVIIVTGFVMGRFWVFMTLGGRA